MFSTSQRYKIEAYKHIGTWEALNYANQKITFGHETASGTYEIDESQNPNWIDINFSDARNAKGIIEFMDKNTFRIQLTDHVAKPRPVAFDQKEQLILRKVE